MDSPFFIEGVVVGSGVDGGAVALVILGLVAVWLLYGVSSGLRLCMIVVAVDVGRTDAVVFDRG